MKQPMTKHLLLTMVGLAMMEPQLLNHMTQQKEVHKCPFCKGHFEGIQKFCPQCNGRLIKKGTSDQFVEGVE